MSYINTKPPKRGWLNVFVTSYAHFIGDYYSNILPVMLPILALQFDLSYSQCGMLYMIFQVAASFLQAPIGIAADKKNLGIIFPLSIMLCGVFASAVGLSTSPMMLIIIVFVSGICASGFHPIAGGILPSVSPKNHEVLATSIFIVGGNIGFAIAPFLTALYLKYFSQQELFYLAIIPVLSALLLIIRRLHIKENNYSGVDSISIKRILSNKPFLWLVASIACRSVCYCAFVIYLPLLLSIRGISSVNASAVLMTMLAGTAVGGLVVGGLSLRYKLIQLIFGSYIFTFAMIVIFLFNADDSLISFISIFFAGLGMYGSTPPAIVWAQKLLPHADSFATSMMLGFTFGIGYILCVFIGILGDYIGLLESIRIFTIISLILACILIIKVRNEE